MTERTYAAVVREISTSLFALTRLGLTQDQAFEILNSCDEVLVYEDDIVLVHGSRHGISTAELLERYGLN